MAGFVGESNTLAGTLVQVRADSEIRLASGLVVRSHRGSSPGHRLHIRASVRTGGPGVKTMRGRRGTARPGPRGRVCRRYHPLLGGRGGRAPALGQRPNDVRPTLRPGVEVSIGWRTTTAALRRSLMSCAPGRRGRGPAHCRGRAAKSVVAPGPPGPPLRDARRSGPSARCCSRASCRQNRVQNFIGLLWAAR